MMITTPSGGSRPHREVLGPVELRAEGAETQEAPSSERPGEDGAGWVLDAQDAGDAGRAMLCALAEQRFYAGDLAQAKALHASVPPTTGNTDRRGVGSAGRSRPSSRGTPSPGGEREPKPPRRPAGRGCLAGRQPRVRREPGLALPLMSGAQARS